MEPPLPVNVGVIGNVASVYFGWGQGFSFFFSSSHTMGARMMSAAIGDEGYDEGDTQPVLFGTDSAMPDFDNSLFDLTRQSPNITRLPDRDAVTDLVKRLGMPANSQLRRVTPADGADMAFVCDAATISVFFFRGFPQVDKEEPGAPRVVAPITPDLYDILKEIPIPAPVDEHMVTCPGETRSAEEAPLSKGQRMDSSPKIGRPSNSPGRYIL
jgi:hypothetical protein